MENVPWCNEVSSMSVGGFGLVLFAGVRLSFVCLVLSLFLSLLFSYLSFSLSLSRQFSFLTFLAPFFLYDDFPINLKNNSQVELFVKELEKMLPDYALASEHAHSNCFLLAHKKVRPDS